MLQIYYLKQFKEPQYIIYLKQLKDNLITYIVR